MILPERSKERREYASLNAGVFPRRTAIALRPGRAFLLLMAEENGMVSHAVYDVSLEDVYSDANALLFRGR